MFLDNSPKYYRTPLAGVFLYPILKIYTVTVSQSATVSQSVTVSQKFPGMYLPTKDEFYYVSTQKSDLINISLLTSKHVQYLLIVSCVVNDSHENGFSM